MIFSSKDQQTVNSLCECQKDANEMVCKVQKQRKENKIMEERFEKELARVKDKRDDLREDVKGLTEEIEKEEKLS